MCFREHVPIDERDSLLSRLQGIFDRIREDAEYAAKEIKNLRDVKSDRWKCCACGQMRVLRRPIAAGRLDPCVRCGKSDFTTDGLPPRTSPPDDPEARHSFPQ